MTLRHLWPFFNAYLTTTRKDFVEMSGGGKKRAIKAPATATAQWLRRVAESDL
jgi:hypothetical protein